MRKRNSDNELNIFGSGFFLAGIGNYLRRTSSVSVSLHLPRPCRGFHADQLTINQDMPSSFL